jgi:hypothetical protein
MISKKMKRKRGGGVRTLPYVEISPVTFLFFIHIYKHIIQPFLDLLVNWGGEF